MGKSLIYFAILTSLLGLVVRHYHHYALCILLFWTALLAAICGVLLYRRHPLSDLVEDMRRQAD